MWLDLMTIQNVMGFCHSLFPVAKYATSYTPTYPLGQLGYVLCGMDQVSGSGSGKTEWECGGVSLEWESVRVCT